MKARLLLAGLLVIGAGNLQARTRADEIKQAQDAVAELRERYGDQHPRLSEARLRAAVWQRFERENRQEPLVLQQAWVELDVLRLKYLERHPDFIAQQARVTAMEAQLAAAPRSPDALLEAVGELGGAWHASRRKASEIPGSGAQGDGLSQVSRGPWSGKP